MKSSRTIKFFAILTALAMAFGVQAALPALATSNATITVEVSSGTPNLPITVGLSGAEIVTDQNLTTNSQGNATATFIVITDGFYLPTVFASDGSGNHTFAPTQYPMGVTVDGSHRSLTSNVQLRPVSTVVLTVSGIPSGTNSLTTAISSTGMVQRNGNPITPISSPTSTEVVTIEDVPAGTWNISVAADSSMSGTVQVTTTNSSATITSAVSLSPTFNASGTVTDATGTPLSGVSLNLFGPGGSSPCAGSCSSITTDSQGQFTITGLTTTTFDVELSKTISGARVSFQSPVPSGIASNPVSIIFPIGTGSISGFVKNDVTEAPISGVSVSASVWIAGSSRSLMVMTTSNAQGGYSLPALTSGNISAYSYANDFQSSNWTTLLSSGQQKTKDIYLVPNASGTSSLSGFVKNDSTSSVVSGAYVYLSNVATGASVNGQTTNGLGRYEFSNIPDGVYRLNVSGQTFRFTSRTVTVSGITTAPDIRLTPVSVGNATVSGVVTNSLTGAPVQNANVSLWTSENWFHATTNANGAWSVTGVANGSYSFYVSPPNGSQTIYDYEDRPNVEVFSANVVRNATLRAVTAGTGSISGVLKDANTHAPLAGAQMFAFMTSSGYSIEPVTTNARGEFSFTSLPSGQYMVTASLQGYIGIQLSNPEESEQGGGGGGPGAPVGTVDLQDGENARLAAKLVKEISGAYSISGTVTTASNRLASNTGVAVRTEAGQFLTYSSTDDDGHYVINNLVDGTYVLTTSSYSSAYGLAEARVTISGSNVIQNLTLAAAGVITGSVLDSNGSALQCAVVSAYRVNGDGTRGDLTSASMSEADSSQGTGSGAYTLSHLAAGDYYLRVSQNCWNGTSSVTANFASAFYSDTVRAGTENPLVRVSVTAGQVTTGKDFTLSANGGEISGKIVVKTPEGFAELASNRYVTVSIYKLVSGTYQVQGYQSKWVSGRDGGAFKINGLPAGSYKLKISDPMNSSRGVETMYLGGDSLATAEVITITAGRKLYLGNVEVANKVPTTAAEPVSTADLTAATQDQIDAPDSVEANQVISVNVGEDLAGEYVTVWAHSTPTALTDWVQVAADGTVSAIVSASLPQGEHKIVVQDVDDQVVGWSGTSVGAEGSATDGSSPVKKVRVIGSLNPTESTTTTLVASGPMKSNKSTTSSAAADDISATSSGASESPVVAIVITIVGILALIFALLLITAWILRGRRMS